MTVSLLSTSIAMAIGLPIFALGERIRERKERRLGGPHTLPERTSHEQVRILHQDRAQPAHPRPCVRGASAPASQETSGGEPVESPGHYVWLGQALAELGLSDVANVESWDVLDAAFPADPLLWNCGKYLLRQGRKGGEEKRLEDLRKARQYLDRQIAQLSREVSD